MNVATDHLPPRRTGRRSGGKCAGSGRSSRKGLLKDEMMDHIGRQNAIGMAELYEIICGREWTNRINDTREIRKLITALRNEGRPICSISNRNGGGYYLAAAGSELEEYLKNNERRALRILARNSKIKKVALPEYLGQVRLALEEEVA